MKLTSRIALLTIAATGLTSAASVSLTTSSNVDFTTDSSSYTNALATGWTASVGYYTGGALSTTSTFDDINTGWVNVATVNFATAALPVGGVAGWFDIPTTSTDGSPSSTIAGQFVTLWVTNGSNGNLLMTSINDKYKLDTAVPSSTSSAISAAQVPNWTVNLGTFTSGGVNASYGGSYVVNVAAPIPEPSAALLGAFGAIGLLRRRRI